ncbi:UNVERIFIED_CONTAM: hypothetical protein Sradi_7090600 [Sesamum radiatum]|uniref:Uncharacterized protein n=1 Tax=Sesamum radiatum TaxID=300843 RepID=A0AAW2J564_SESRA
MGDERDPLAAKKRKVDEHMGPIEEVKTIELTQQPGRRPTKIGTLLDAQLEKTLVAFLQENISAFTWDAVDMCGIDPEIMVHRLNFYVVDDGASRERRHASRTSGHEHP